MSAFLRSSFVFAPSYQPSVFLIYQTQAWQSPDAALTLARRMALNHPPMDVGRHLASPVRLLALFVLLAGIPLAALGWLSWRLLEQEHALDAQRLRERLENAAALITTELDRRFTAWDTLLAGAARRDPVSLPANSVLILLDSRGVHHLQGIRLPYYPAVSVPAEDHGALVASAEMHEFGPERNLAKAGAAYRALAGSKDMSVRGLALMRLARVLRQDLKLQDAVAVYSELAALGQTPVAGSPAGLVALRERIALLKATGDDRGATREAALLAAALSEGRFRIDHATYEFYKESLPDSQMVAVPPLATRLAAAMEGLWPAFQQQQAGRTTVASVTDAGAFAAVWRPTPQGTAAMVGGLDDVIAPAREMAQKLGVRWALADPAGRRIWGGGLESDRGIVRTAAETGLPWTMRVTLDGRTSTSAVASSRRRLFAAGFGLMALIMAASGYFVFRSVNNELNVARLQSDFVAGVSHEFRTPLTAMCHLTELLEAGGTASERLPIYYRALGKETRRLHAMVESLLDFGRIDSGRRRYDLSETDAAEFVRRTVQEFRDQTGRGSATSCVARTGRG